MLRRRLPRALSAQDEQRLSGAIAAIRRAAGLGAALDDRGLSAFSMSDASVGVLIELTVTAATSADPVAAHQAQTAAARYGSMLLDLDLRALRERHEGQTAK